jgi:tetratricopeptide (TPR) repeat protein
MQKKSSLKLLLLLLAVMLSTQGCGVVNKLRAKDSLNEGVREFNKGKYEQAEEKFKHALELAPDMINAQLFYARSLNARFEQSLTEPLGMETIKAYDNIIKMNANDQEAVDRALAFKANVYDKLSNVSADKSEEYKKLHHDVLLERVNLPSAKASAKADVYYTIGVDMWKAAYAMSSPYVSKKQPIPPDVQQKMVPNISKAHEFLLKAITDDPSYANAFYYRTLVYREEAKLTSDQTKLKELEKKINDDLAMYKKIQDQQKAQATQTSGEAAK